MDNDKQGRKMASNIYAELHKKNINAEIAYPSKQNKDWNEVLKKKLGKQISI